MDPLVFLLSILLTSTISGALGMGGGIILMFTFMTTMPVPQALILHGIVQVSSNGFRSIINKKHIDWKIVFYYILGAVISYAFFTYISFRPSKRIIYITLGLIPFLSLFKNTATFFNIKRKGRSILCGILVSAGQVISGASGGVLDLFYLSSPMNRFSIVATKAMTQTVGHMAKTFFFVNAFEFNLETLSNEIILIAIITPLLGGIIGKIILKEFSDKFFLKTAKVLMISMSFSFLYKGFV